MRKDKQHLRKHAGIRIYWLFSVWGAVLLIGAVLVLTATISGWQIGQQNYYALSILISFSSFVATSFFSVAIYNHNTAARELNSEIRNQTNAVNRRAELFRNLQFVASNYTIVDFVDFMEIYPEYETYRAKLEDTKQFEFYLLEQGLDKNAVIGNIDGYTFLTVRIPVKIVEGKSVGKIIFKRIKFMKGSEAHRFWPAADTTSKALILFNEKDNRTEALINLVMRSDSSFYNINDINPFSKIKIDLQIESLLGVIIDGAIELYFTNPEKIEKTGKSRYRINSSQFELTDTPKLKLHKEYE